VIRNGPGRAAAAKPFLLAALTAALSRPVMFIQLAALSLSRLEERCSFFLAQLRSSKQKYEQARTASTSTNERDERGQINRDERTNGDGPR